MNEELDQVADVAMVELINTLTTVKDFAVEQAPGVIQELLKWNLLANGIWGVVFGACLIAGVVAIVYGVRHRWDDGIFAWVFISIVLAILTTCFAVDALKLWIAPKVWLVEYAANLVS